MPGRIWSSLRATLAALFARLSHLRLLVVDWIASPWRRAMALSIALLAALVIHPPVAAVMPGEVALRVNRLTGSLQLFHEGSALCLPLVHELRRYSLRDQVSRLSRAESSSGGEPFQSFEGLPIGMRVTTRWALDPERISASARSLPDDIGAGLIEPEVDDVLRRALAKKSVRQIFADERLQIEEAVTSEVRARLESEGVKLKALSLGSVDLPPEYRRGLEALLTDELAVTRTAQTLALKESSLKENALEAQAEKSRRETIAEAAASEEMIAARAHAEAMKHVLPLKTKEIQQRRLEAEARAVEKKRDAQSNAEARLIEAGAEAEARHKLAEADAYKLEVTGKAESEQYERDAEVLTRNPLLVQKAFAEKLSERMQVVVAPPSTAGFFAAGLLGGGAGARPVGADERRPGDAVARGDQ